MVGGSLYRQMQEEKNNYEIIGTTSRDLNLLNQNDVENYVGLNKPDIAILCAARVGGVLSNSKYPATFALENQIMQVNAVHSLIKNGIKRIIFIGSSCIYPVAAPLPLNPSSLGEGKLEATNQWYAMAKLSMISILDAVNKQYGISVSTLLPTNLYGPNDNFHLEDGHVIPGLIHKAHLAKINAESTLKVWGTGNPYREVLFVDDFARSVLSVLNDLESPAVLNVGSGEEFQIRDLAQAICDVVGFKGDLEFQSSKPDGNFRKSLDSSDIRKLGWEPKVNLENGLKITYEWFKSNYESIRQKGVL